MAVIGNFTVSDTEDLCYANLRLYEAAVGRRAVVGLHKAGHRDLSSHGFVLANVRTAARSLLTPDVGKCLQILTRYRKIGVRQVRLASGLILFSYLVSHYINHSLGNISLDAMEYGLWFHMTFWQSPAGTLLLYPALAVHGSLGLWALYQRRFFRWKIAEIVQLTLGLSIPALPCTHLIGERLGVTLYGLQRSYAQALYNFWIARPELGFLMATLLLVAWIHGCIGLYFWLRLKRLFQAWRLSCSG